MDTFELFNNGKLFIKPFLHFRIVEGKKGHCLLNIGKMILMIDSGNREIISQGNESG